jgi:TonB family protein
MRSWCFAASLLFHGGLVGLVALLPQGAISTGHAERGLRMLAPLIAPPAELTQTTPNRGRIGKEFTLESLRAPRRIQMPPLLARGAQPPSLPEPPQLEGQAARVQPPPLGTTPLGVPPPPQIQPVEKPKLAFETPGAPAGVPAGTGTIAPPGASVQEAVRAAIRRGPAGGLIVGDFGGGALEGVPFPPSPGARSNLELLSNPQGVDFRPYLIGVLAAVRRNWLAVIPESARMGRRGKVQIQFAISRDGYVPKLVIALPSGADALDRAAVAGVSASNPFPPLPPEFRGDQIRLQLTFFYNLPAQ